MQTKTRKPLDHHRQCCWAALLTAHIYFAAALSPIAAEGLDDGRVLYDNTANEEVRIKGRAYRTRDGTTVHMTGDKQWIAKPGYAFLVYPEGNPATQINLSANRFFFSIITADGESQWESSGPQYSESESCKVLTLAITPDLLRRHRSIALGAKERVAKEGPRILVQNTTKHRLTVEFRVVQNKESSASEFICNVSVDPNVVRYFQTKRGTVLEGKPIVIGIDGSPAGYCFTLDQIEFTKSGDIWVTITDSINHSNLATEPTLPDSSDMPLLGEKEESKTNPGVPIKKDLQSDEDKLAEEQRSRRNDEYVRELNRQMIEIRRQQDKSRMDSLNYLRKRFNDSERYLFDQSRERRLP